MKTRLFLLIACSLFLFFACQDKPAEQSPAYPRKEIKKTPAAKVIQRDPFCIAAVGDIMLGTAYPNKNTLPPDSAKNSFKNVIYELHNADVVFGNLEGTLLDTGKPANYKLHFRSKGYLFRMPQSYGSILKDAGFNVLSLANNHSGDFGNAGRISTMKVLDSLGICYGGLLSHPSSILKINGTTYGFCAFAPSGETLSMFDMKNAGRIIQKLKQQCDIVIVSFHGGAEGAASEHIPFATEKLNSEQRGDVYDFAHHAVDAGADLILGNGPHVCRAMELYKKRLIAYSLGNFCTYKCISISGSCGIAPLLKIYVNKNGEFLNGHIIACKQTRAKGLEPDTLNQAITRIKTLTEADFPKSGLSILNDGEIMPLKE